MKNLQQNLLLFLAMCLCGLCTWQWVVQARQHLAAEKLDKIIFDQATKIQDCTNSMKNMDAEIAGLSARVAELKQDAMSNGQVTVQLRRDNERLRSDATGMSNEITQYKDALAKLEAQLKETAVGVEKQNQVIKDVAAQRDDAIKKYNDSMKERNDLVEKYNALVDRFNKLQSASATNSDKP